MARIAGIDLPNKPVSIALTYIFGIGRSSARAICEKTDIDPARRMNDLTAEDINELRNVIERGMVLCDGQDILPTHLPAELSDARPLASASPVPETDLPPEGIDLEHLVSQMELRLIQDALARTDGNQAEAAKLLSISRDQLRYRLQKYT